MRLRLGTLVAIFGLFVSLSTEIAPTGHAAGVGAAPDCSVPNPNLPVYVPPSASAADKRASTIKISLTDKKNDQSAVTKTCTTVARKKLTRVDLQSDLKSVSYIVARHGTKAGLTITYTIWPPGVIFQPASQPAGQVVTQQFVTVLPDSGYQIVADNEGNGDPVYVNVSNGGSDYYDRACEQSTVKAPWGGRTVTVFVPLQCFVALNVPVSRFSSSSNIVNGSTVTTDQVPTTRAVPLTPH